METEKPKGNGNLMEKNLKNIVYVLAAVAVVLLGVLIYVYIDRSGMIKDLTIEKEDLTQQMVQLRADYDSLSTTNDTLALHLEEEKERVDLLIEKIKTTEATNRARIRQYEKELGTLRSIMKNYIVQIDSLNTLNTQLRKDAALARKEAKEKSQAYDKLRTTTDEYAKQVEKGSVLKGRNFVMKGINDSGKETDRSSRITKLRVCFSIIENSIAKTGAKKLFIRIKGPDGVLLTNSRQGVFMLDGEQCIYSAMREVDYEGAELEVCIFFGENTFTKGVYSAEVFSEQGRMGSADVVLK